MKKQTYYLDVTDWPAPVMVSFFYDPEMKHAWGRGCTFCTLEGGAVAAVAYCSYADNWSETRGRKTAFTKAVQQLPKAERGPFWAGYFKQFPTKRAKLKSANRDAVAAWLRSLLETELPCSY